MTDSVECGFKAPVDADAFESRSYQEYLLRRAASGRNPAPEKDWLEYRRVLAAYLGEC